MFLKWLKNVPVGHYVSSDMNTYGREARHHYVLEEDVLPDPDDPEDVIIFVWSNVEEELPPDFTEQDDDAARHAKARCNTLASCWR